MYLDGLDESDQKIVRLLIETRAFRIPISGIKSACRGWR